MMPPRHPYAMGYPAVRQPAAPAAAAATAQSAASKAAVASDAAAVEAAVTISQMRFSPARVTVKKGATVTWTQRDNMPHTITANNGSFGSQTLNGGASYSRTFDEPGEYRYYCSLHPSMRGEIVVTE
jgi:amicyanin